MASINCPQKECNRTFKKLVIVTNFSFVPEETYSACPYCLTRINIGSKKYGPTCIAPEKPANIGSGDSNEASIVPQTIQVYSLTEKSEQTLNSLVFNSQAPQKIVLKNIKKLEQEKADLITELDELRKAATEKIDCLENEVAILREERKILKKLASS